MDPATIKVVSEETGLGYMIINESDFDSKVHKKYSPPKAEKPPEGEGK